MLRQVCLLLFFFISPVLLFAQQPDSMDIKKDTIIIKDSSLVKQPDSSAINSDTAKKSTLHIKQSYSIALQNILKENRFLNAAGLPAAMENQIRKPFDQDHFFYLLAILGLILGFFRFFYTRYFNNLFRVFFNASLRQSQLTDQLLQAKLPSLFFNILFVL